jgi:hypothetical protein
VAPAGKRGQRTSVKKAGTNLGLIDVYFVDVVPRVRKLRLCDSYRCLHIPLSGVLGITVYSSRGVNGSDDLEAGSYNHGVERRGSNRGRSLAELLYNDYAGTVLTGHGSYSSS